ncbi:MAG: hypothetical protein C5B50_07995 [Verrucomicrobia bacterium]|nr:MAG: hypothetical protein C5B50_07995 [Verrucomicrobiota bacterium]
MKPDPIIEELWKTKKELAREADHNTHQFFENLRKWEAEHPHPSPALRSAEDLQNLIAEREQRRTPEAELALKDEPRRKD